MSESRRARVRSTLRTYADFKRVFNNKTRFFRDGLGFYFRKSDGLKFRYGMSVPKRYGKAVQRNKVRRRIREVIRLMDSVPDSAEVVVSVYRPCDEFSYDTIKRLITWGFHRIERS